MREWPENRQKNRRKNSQYKGILPSIIIMIYLLIPLAVTIIYSLFQKWTDIVPEGFSVSAYRELFANQEFIHSIGRSILLCVVPIAITVGIVLLAMFATTLYFPGLEKYIQIICMIPYTIQGVILSVSILSLYVSSKTFLSNRLVMLFGAYSVIIMPYIYQGIRNGMRTIHVATLIDAAQMLGCTRLYAFFRIIVPNILSSVIASSLLAVGIIFGDYVLIRNLAGISYQNMQIFLYQTMKSDSIKASAVFVVIMCITCLIAAVTLYMNRREKSGHK